MTMAELFNLCNAQGVSLANRGDRLSLRPATAVTEAIKAGALEHKAKLLALLPDTAVADAVFEKLKQGRLEKDERAAIRLVENATQAQQQEWLTLATAELNAAIADDRLLMEWQQERQLLLARIAKSRVLPAIQRMQMLVDETPANEAALLDWLQRAFSLEADLRCEGHLHPPEPPVDAFYRYADANSRPCIQEEAMRWTWEGADQWWEARYYPAPKQSAKYKSVLVVAGNGRQSPRQEAKDDEEMRGLENFLWGCER